MPGQYFEPTKGYPYDDAIARFEVVKSRGELKGMLWHQGEADSNSERAPKYEERLQTVFGNFRRDLGQADLPIVIGQLGSFAGKEWSDARRQVDAVHQEVAKADPRVGLVSAAGVESKADLVHFNAVSLDEFGERYAAAFRELMMSR